MAPAALLLLAAAAALPGCAQQVRVNGSWQDDAAHDQAYTRVLVVAVSPDVNQRCAFEQFLVVQIQGEVEILTKVFDTRDAALVYELNTKARDLESRESGLAIVTGPIADRLRKDGPVR